MTCFINIIYNNTQNDVFIFSILAGEDPEHICGGGALALARIRACM